MDAWRPPTPSQLRRLVEELAEAGLDLDGSASWHDLAIEEIAYAIRPKVHERYVPELRGDDRAHHRPGRVARRSPA